MSNMLEKTQYNYEMYDYSNTQKPNVYTKAKIKKLDRQSKHKIPKGKEDTNINKITSFPSNPIVFGPGIWFTFHIMGLLSTDEVTINCYINFVTDIIDKLPCLDCRKHAQKYLKNEPPQSYRFYEDEKGNKNGMFYWSWKFHNSVNIRLGKELLQYNDALSMYTNLSKNEQACSHLCTTT
jgi:hypothetical protein